MRIGQSAAKNCLYYFPNDEKGDSIKRYYHPIFTRYSCNSDGILYGVKGLPLKSNTSNTTGYKTITVREGKIQKQYRVHRFVFECINSRLIRDGLVINHKDGCKTNNHPLNLEEITPKENTEHAFSSGLIKPLMGEANGCAIITADIVRNIIRDIMVYNLSNKELSIKYEIDPKHISLLRNKKRWKFIFREDEFKTYNISRSEYLDRDINDSYYLIYLCLNTNLNSRKIAQKFKIHPSNVSRFRKDNNCIWKKLYKKYKQLSSTTIENLKLRFESE